MDAFPSSVEGVPCRACGGVRAPEGMNPYGLCDNCWVSVRLFSGCASDGRRYGEAITKTDKDITESEVTGWLAFKLVKDLKRFKRNGMAGRCEAISGWAYGRNQGKQCAHVATQYRDDHKVCRSHALSLTNAYVNERQSDHYELMRDTLTTLRDADPRFAAIIREVAHIAANSTQPAVEKERA